MCWKSTVHYMCTILLLLPGIISGQESRARITNVSFEAVELEGTKIIVYYDIANASPVEQFEIELAFVDDEDFYYYPETMTGDVGFAIKGGKKRRIVWDIFQDVDEVGRIKAIVNISSVTEIPGGAGKALLSVPVPGLGDIFVINSKNALIKPYYKTILAYGLTGYGVYQYFNADRLYEDYNNSTERSNFDNLYNKANSAHHQSYIFMGLGAAIWVSDVVWVAVKGLSNTRNHDNSAAIRKNRIIVDPNPFGGMNLAYVLTF